MIQELITRIDNVVIHHIKIDGVWLNHIVKEISRYHIEKGCPRIFHPPHTMRICENCNHITKKDQIWQKYEQPNLPRPKVVVVEEGLL